MTPTVVARERELASVEAFLDEVRSAPGALLVEGEAGIGKSTLWLAAVERARERELRVLSSRPAEAERGLAYAGLGDLLEGVLEETLPELLPPRRRALEIATLRDEAVDDPVDRRAVAVAVRDVLQLLSERGPVVVAVDDVQWLDASSAGALEFALRRLETTPLAVLLARRVVDGAQEPGFEHAFPAERIQILEVGPLSAGALHRLLHDRLGRAFPRQTLLRIHEQSGGNPFFALELARALAPDADPAQPLPLPETLDELMRARIAALPAETRQALAVVSALGTTREGLLEEAGVATETLGPAFEAHVIEREGGAVRFTHPLLASVLYGDLGDERRSVHGRIAQIVDDPVARARHLALSEEEPDAAVAEVLDEAARLAGDRGASAAAAELLEHAARLTPAGTPEERRRRALAAAGAYRAAGEWTRARAIATELLAETNEGSWRAEALVLLAELETHDTGMRLLEQALREAASRPRLQAAIHCRLAWIKRYRGDDANAPAALALAEALDDDELRVRARAVQAVLAWFKGEAEAPADLPALVQKLPAALGADRLVQEATQALANTLATSSRRDEARALLEREYLEWRERDERKSARALWGLAWVEFWAGDWRLAEAHAARSHDLSIQYGVEVPQDHLPLAVIAVHRGRHELARQHSERALALAEIQLGASPPQHLAVIGLVALVAGDTSSAAASLERAEQRAADLAWGEPTVRWWTPDYVELLLQLGRGAEAVRLLDAWEADAARVQRDWVFPHVTRCRGLVAAADGEVERALELLERAVAEHDEVGDPFGRARALLAVGIVRRRLRQKRPAREAIEEAVAAFETIGADGWAARGRAELGRLGGRKREEGLTAAEQRVAELVAEGRTNRQVAEALFLGERTVASHLTHIYAKLGIRSRTELARRLRPAEPAAQSKVPTF
jgi:DNA-binding CsgD family transcriptional regulator